jgi:hypothetical protein
MTKTDLAMNLLFATVFLVGLLLTGCVDMKAEWAAKDHARCTSYGAARGSPAYVNCRAQLDSARGIAIATQAAGK